ncbi:hypothetical protein L7F22_049263 [Adiantum nelumboides]|nr:hypothetical protein [Adiantum nelumboides]
MSAASDLSFLYHGLRPSSSVTSAKVMNASKGITEDANLDLAQTSAETAQTVNHTVKIRRRSNRKTSEAETSGATRPEFSTSNGERYFPGSRRQRASKESKVTSVSDYIRTVMEQLQSGSTQSVVSDHGVADHDASLLSEQTTTAYPPTSLQYNPLTPARINPSTCGNISEQQVWLMIVERMREEIIKARDVHRADLYQFKNSKRRRCSSATAGVGITSQKETNSEADRQPYCTACSPKQSHASAVTMCGHYLCWDCLCKWHHKEAASSSLTASKKECPCCKKILSKSQVTFLGTKPDDGLAARPDRSTSLSSATDQRDNLLQAAAIPILSARLQYNLSAYNPILTAGNRDSQSHEVLSSMAAKICPSANSDLGAYNPQQGHINGSGGQLCSYITDQQNQNLIVEATDLSVMNNVVTSKNIVAENYDNLCDAGMGLDAFIYQPDCACMSSQLMNNCDNERMLAYTKQAAASVHQDIVPCSWCPPVISSNEQICANFNLESSRQAIYNQMNVALRSHNGNAALDADETHRISKGSYSSHENIRTTSSINDEEGGSNAMIDIHKVLELDASDETFTDAEKIELIQLQEALKRQLACHEPPNVQSSLWLSTLLATISNQQSGPSQNTSYINNGYELPKASITGTPYETLFERQDIQTPQSNQSISNGVFHAEVSSNPLSTLEGCITTNYNAEQQALNFSSGESTFSSTISARSPFLTNNHNKNDATTAGSSSAAAYGPYQDDAMSNWSSLYDRDAWAWPMFDDGGGHSCWE